MKHISSKKALVALACVFNVFMLCSGLNCYDCTAYEGGKDTDSCVTPKSNTKTIGCIVSKEQNFTHCAKFYSNRRGEGFGVMRRCCSTLPPRKEDQQSGCHILIQAYDEKTLCQPSAAAKQDVGPSPFTNEACFCNRADNCNNWKGLRVTSGGIRTSTPLIMSDAGSVCVIFLVVINTLQLVSTN